MTRPDLESKLGRFHIIFTRYRRIFNFPPETENRVDKYVQVQSVLVQLVWVLFVWLLFFFYFFLGAVFLGAVCLIAVCPVTLCLGAVSSRCSLSKFSLPEYHLFGPSFLRYILPRTSLSRSEDKPQVMKAKMSPGTTLTILDHLRQLS